MIFAVFLRVKAATAFSAS